jgi:predicted nicotinamide N-methyase
VVEGERFAIERPADDEPLVREAVARGDLDPSYWARLWPMALVSAGWALRSAIIGPGVRVLEIGCGLGLVGIAAARRGADVLMTDLDERGVALARRNAERNGAAARVERFDWRDHPPPAWAFDVVLGSDVLYRPAAHVEIATLATRLAARAPCVLVLADPNRPAADAAAEALERAGLSVWTTAAPGGRMLLAQVASR